MMSIKQRLPIVVIAAFTLMAAGAQATHWPVAGGEPSRSGNQPGDRAVLPMDFRWRTGESVRTSPIITAGADLTAQRVAYGYFTNNELQTDLDAVVRITRLSNNTDPTSTTIDDEQPGEGVPGTPSDTDTFGPVGDVAPLDASRHDAAPTQLYVVHNDDNQETFVRSTQPGIPDSHGPNPAGNDIALAQIDIATGARIRDAGIGSPNPNGTPNTNGYTIESAPVMGADDGTGTRDIFFVARSATEKRLFRARVPNAASSTPNTPTLTVSPPIADLNPRARPALITMLEPDNARPVTMVAMATTDGVKTIRARSENLNDFGPSISGLGNTTTPSAPALTTGNMFTERPTFFYVASTTGGGETVVSKLRQEPGENGGDPSLLNLEVIASSPGLPGTAGPGLAVAQEIPTGEDAEPRPGRVVVPTSANLYSLNTENLGAGDPPSLFDDPAPEAVGGFGQTIPATSGDLGFAATTGGQQHVFYVTPRNGSLRVAIDDTEIPTETATEATSSVGQPALSRGRVVFPSNKGVFTYGPVVSIMSPLPGAKVDDTEPLSAHTTDSTATQIVFKIDGVTVGTGPVTANVATFNWNSLNVPDGEHLLTAETGGEKSAQRPIVVDNFEPPTARLTVSPTVGNVGQDVTLNASASTATAGEANDAITKYAFETDGDNDYNDIVGTSSIVKTQFSTPGTKTVSVRVTDGHGDTDTATVTFRVNAPPTVSLTATPNPATAGQQVTVDATGSTDSDGTIAKYEFDLDGNGTFELDNGTNPKTTKALTTTTNVGVRVTDNEGGQTIKTVTVTVPAANQAPTASFIVAPNPGLVNQDVGFSAAASKDPDGTIAKYEWDFDGNGTFERNTGTSPLAANKFTTAGVFKVGLRVTDNAGATGTTTVDVIITGSRCVATSRCTPRLSASVTPKRDRRLPYRFTTRGRLTLPAGLPRAEGCTGRVSVQIKRGKRTLSNRRVRLNSSCRFTSRVTFRDRKRLGSSKSLRFTARYLGNKVLKPRSASVKTVRIG